MQDMRRRQLTMQRHGRLCRVGVEDSVKADLVRDVGNLIRMVDGFFLDLQRMDRSVPRFRLLVDGLSQVAFENLHDTVSVGVIVNQTAFAGIPDDKDQVCFAVDIIDNIPCISSALICMSVTLPVLYVGCVFGHDGFDVVGVDMG